MHTALAMHDLTISDSKNNQSYHQLLLVLLFKLKLQKNSFAVQISSNHVVKQYILGEDYAKASDICPFGTCFQGVTYLQEV